MDSLFAILIFTPYIKLQNCIDQDKEVTKSDIVSAYPSSIKKTGQSAGPGGNRLLQPALWSQPGLIKLGSTSKTSRA